MLLVQIDGDTWLEPLEPRHVVELFRLIDRERDFLRRWLPWVDAVKTADDTRAFVTMSQQQEAQNQGVQTVIRHGGAFVGVVGQHAIDWENRSTSLGYWLAEGAQGRGLATKAVGAHVQYAFARLGLHRVEVRCASENSASQAVPTRLGFVREGARRDAEWLGDHFVDHVVFSLLDGEWQQPAAPPRTE